MVDKNRMPEVLDTNHVTHERTMETPREVGDRDTLVHRSSSLFRVRA